MTTKNGKASLLLVDDDPDLLRLLTIRLKSNGYQVTAVESGQRALAAIAAARPDLVLTDLRMEGMDGMALFEEIQAAYPGLPVIILTAHGSIPDAVGAVKRGVFGYLTKPYDADELLSQIERALTLHGSSGTTQAGVGQAWREDIVTRSTLMEDLLAKAQRVAAGDASVLIQGESGSGKELLARAIHRSSPRAAEPFVAINCGAIPETLLESELFGHTKGSFTGAIADQRGLFVAADKGTLFLDEIGDMPLALQVKLLRVLQEREVRPVGSAQTVKVDVRIISATHRDLKAQCAAGRFREDLYYRLNVVSLALPPLCERREDIPLLAQHFVAQLAERYRKTIGGFAPEAMEALIAAAWKGNVRELQNVVEKCVALSATEVIPASLVQRALDAPAEELASFDEARRTFEREYLAQLLRTTAGNVSQAARLAKRNRSDFYSLLNRHQLDPVAFKK